MARRRLGVVLLVPPPAATEIDGLRRALGDGSLGRIGPHVTLVPPVNVREADLDAVLASVRAVAASHPTVGAVLGPVATFAPVTPVAYLAVDASADLGALAAAVRTGPLDRPLEHAYVPHCTVADSSSDEQLVAAVDLLGGFRAEVRFDHITVLEEQQPGRVWRPIADAPFDVPAGRVGQGGLAVDIEVTAQVPPAAASLLGPSVASWAVTARVDGVVVGAASGTGAELVALTVAEGHRRLGIGRHLLAAAEAEARRRGEVRLGASLSEAEAEAEAVALLAGAGWVDRGHGRWERRLSGA